MILKWIRVLMGFLTVTGVAAAVFSVSGAWADDGPLAAQSGTVSTVSDEIEKPSVARTPSGTWFDTVFVTADRRPDRLFDTPYTGDVVDLAGFRDQRLHRTVPEALRDVPGVMVQKTSHGQGSPYIRGFTGFRTLMMVDGIRLNNSTFREGPNEYWALIDPHSIDRLEVVKGPSSTLYGSDAIGGAVNAILKGPSSWGEGLNCDRRVFYRFSSAEASNVGRVEIDATFDKHLGALFGGTFQQFGDLSRGGGHGRQDKTGYTDFGGDARVEFAFTPDARLTVARYDLYRDDAWRTHKTIYGLGWHGTTVGDELERAIDYNRTLTYVRYEQRNIGGPVDAMQFTGSFQEIDEQQIRCRGNLRRDKQGVDVDTYGFGAQFESPSPVGRFTYGVEWYHDRVASFLKKWNADVSFNSEDIQGPVGDRARYDLLGIYAQDQIPIGEKVELTLGGRYTYAKADANRLKDPETGRPISIGESWDTIVGSARLNWYPDQARHYNIFGGVSQGFRAPNLSDLSRLDTARTDEIETASPGLDPEYYLTCEAGVKAQCDDASAQASYFYTDIDDMITRAPTGRVIAGDYEVTKKNSGDGFVHGVELEGAWRFHPQLTAFGAFTWMYGRADVCPTSEPWTRSEPLSRLMPPTGRVGLRWDHPSKKVWVETACTMAARADKLSTSDKEDTQRVPPDGTPGYAVLDVRAGWHPLEDLEIWTGVENVTDRDYRVHGSGVNEPGVSFKVGLSYRF